MAAETRGQQDTNECVKLGSSAVLIRGVALSSASFLDRGRHNGMFRSKSVSKAARSVRPQIQ